MADYASPGSPVAGRVVAASDPVSKFEQENEDLLGQDDALSLSYHIHISPRYHYVYMATPKVACSFIKGCLQRLELGDRTFSRPGEDVHVRSYSPLLSPIQIGSFAKVRADSRFFKFCFIRNPFTRVLSAYLDKIVRNKPQKVSVLRSLGKDESALNEPISFEQFVLALERQSSDKIDPHWCPQVRHLRVRRLRYDFVGHFESVDRDICYVGERIGVDLRPFLLCDYEHQTGATWRLKQYYTTALIERVRRLYEADLDYFGYSFDIADASLPPASARYEDRYVSST